MTAHKSLTRNLIFILASLASLISVPAYARHGEGNILTNRIPEPAAYEFSETRDGGGEIQNPPFENLWTGLNDTGSCDGCHTGLYDEWNGSMMANAWRDPGWRGAFLLVARMTSTDGCDDIAPTLNAGKAKDNSQGYDCASLGTNADGSPKLRSINPFATSATTSAFNMGTPNRAQYSGSGSLMDDFCSRCHMPTNYVDATVNVTPAGLPAFNDPTRRTDALEHGAISPTYDPTSVAPNSLALADPLAAMGTGRESYGFRMDGNRSVNSITGKSGIVCESCHTNVATRLTPYHGYNKTEKPRVAGGPNIKEYYPARLSVSRASQGLAPTEQDMLYPPDDFVPGVNAGSKNLGYAIGAGAFRLSPHALAKPERFGPLAWNDFRATVDPYITDVFSGGGVNRSYSYELAQPPGKHETYYSVKLERAEFCAGCHDVTNPATIKNEFGLWVGGFPIERTYTEFLSSRYADRVGNANYDPNYKRDCQTCHMQQTFGEPGTALTLYEVINGNVIPDAPLDEPSCDRKRHVPGYSHHFVGGNAYVTKMIGADLSSGAVAPYPELLETSFSSADKTSRLHYARFTTAGTGNAAAATQHQRFAWDRLRNAVSMTFSVPGAIAKPAPGVTSFAAINLTIKNDGAGHNFPTGFPEGRAAWVAVHAWDTRGGTVSSPYQLVNGQSVELQIRDSANGNQLTLGVGYLTDTAKPDPLYPACNWELPAGSIDPYAFTMRAVASLDGNCPSLDLPYATAAAPLPANGTRGAQNLQTNGAGIPIDAAGAPVDRDNPERIPHYKDTGGYLNGVWFSTPNGDAFDDSFLKDTRLQPMKGTSNPYAQAVLNRYSVEVPATVMGPIAVTAAVYYQSFEGMVAKKFLGNLANKDDADTLASLALAPGGGPNTPTPEGYPDGSPKLETCVLKGACDRIGKPGVTGEAQLRDALKFDPVVVDGAPPVPVIVKSAAIQVTGAGTTADTVKPTVIINNSLAAPNSGLNAAQIPANRHWSPSPYGGATGNYPVERLGEQNVNPARIVKISFSEPVTGVDANTFYLTTGRGVVVPALMAQIDDTTYALFPYTSALDQTFLAASINIIHVVPSRNGSVIRDAANNVLPNGPTTSPLSDTGHYTFGFKTM